MIKDIAILLPYKENYTKNNAGAASIWLKDYTKKSLLSKQTIIYGNLDTSENPLTNNFKNISLKASFLSKTKTYMNFFYNEYKKNNFKIIEIHNRPEYLKYLIKKKVKAKILFFFHNNPLEIKGSKSINERLNILDKAHKVFFVSKWVQNKFFEKLNFKTKSNCEIAYPSIDKVKKFNTRKNKQIIFTGKLNSLKGYDIFGDAILRILDKYPDWNAVVAGNEPREKFTFNHKNLKIYFHTTDLQYQLSHQMGYIWKNSIVSSVGYYYFKQRWSPKHLKMIEKINSKNIFKTIEQLINNPKKLKSIMFKNFKNPIHDLNNLVKFIDSIKINSLEKNIYISKSLGPKILHISNFNEKNNHRLFNISIASKLTNGLIRNNCDVINFSYRNYLSGKIFKDIDKDILDISTNYRPDLILLGHNNILDKKTLEIFKSKNQKIALWYEDHVVNYGPNWKQNLNLIEKNHDLIDKYFITTHPSEIKSKIMSKKISYLPIPVDQNIENLNIFKNKNRYKDLFFALSHGVNFGGLRAKSFDEREIFLQKLLSRGKNIKFHLLGINNDKPKWNYDFFNEIKICKMALNLSRGKPLKYATSNRIASYIGNGILTFINDKVKFQELFNENEIVFYKNENDLIDKIYNLKDDINKINKISENGKKKYFKLFENKIVSDYLISKIFETTPKFKYGWK